MIAKANRAAPLLLPFALILLLSASGYAQHGWPIEPTDSEHPIGNTMGEFQKYGPGAYQHGGIDVLGTPKFQSDGTENTSAPWVRVTVGGTISSMGNTSGSAYNGTVVRVTGGVDYIYWHLAYDSYHTDYVTNFNNGTAASAGDEIAKLHRWTGCGTGDLDLHHLHYELDDGTDYFSPMADITPNPDPDLPDIAGIYFAQDNSSPWSQFSPVASGGCTVCSGGTDIIAKIRDVDDAGSTLVGADTLWVHNLRWRACPDSNPDCAWQDTHTFDDMPVGWHTSGNASTSAQFSTGTPWISDSDYCSATWLYGIVTNFVGGSPNTAGKWDTAAISDGSYSVSVEATDFAGNVTVRNTRACVQNTTAGTTELTIRDALDDTGAIPYPGRIFFYSPDITANPGTADEDKNINMGVANPIEVRVWNYGSAALPAGTSYDVYLGWGMPSASVPYPLPSNQVVDSVTETVPAGGWPVGASRITTYTWTPAPGSLPLGKHCLIAWVDMPQDPVLNTPAVNWDDNRTQQNISFQDAPPSPDASALSAFWVNPQRMVQQRSLEITFKESGVRRTVRSARLHVGPGLLVETIIGGHVIGGYEGEKPLDPCEQKPGDPCRDACMSWEEATKRGCTQVIGLDPTGVLRLEGIRVNRPVRLMLEVWTEPDAPRGSFVDADVVEFGLLPQHQQVSPVGGLTLRFEH